VFKTLAGFTSGKLGTIAIACVQVEKRFRFTR